MKKKMAATLLAAGLSVVASMTAFAGEWKLEDSGKWWWLEDDGSYPVSTWKEIGGKQYYFGEDGYLLTNTTTPDGYQVGSDGAWVESDTVSLYSYDKIVKAGNRIIFEDLEEFEEGLYSNLGLVSMNPDGSDKKLILPDNNGDNAVSSDRLLPIGEWVYFVYNWENIARIKADGSGFQVLASFDHSIWLQNATDEKLYYSYTDSENKNFYYGSLSLSDFKVSDNDKFSTIDGYWHDGLFYRANTEIKGRIDAFTPDGKLTRTFMIQDYPQNRRVQLPMIRGIFQGKLFVLGADYSGTPGSVFGGYKSYSWTIDINTGDVSPSEKGLQKCSDNWIYYTKNTGIWRYNFSGTDEKFVDTKENLGFSFWVVDGYVYYWEDYTLKVVKE